MGGGGVRVAGVPVPPAGVDVDEAVVGATGDPDGVDGTVDTGDTGDTDDTDVGLRLVDARDDVADRDDVTGTGDDRLAVGAGTDRDVGTGAALVPAASGSGGVDPGEHETEPSISSIPITTVQPRIGLRSQIRSTVAVPAFCCRWLWVGQIKDYSITPLRRKTLAICMCGIALVSGRFVAARRGYLTREQTKPPRHLQCICSNCNGRHSVPGRGSTAQRRPVAFR